MEISIPQDIGDKVFLMQDNRIVERTIDRIYIEVETNMYVEFMLDDKCKVNRDDCFNTKQELIKHISKEEQELPY